MVTKVGGDRDGVPDAGSITICLRCGKWSVFENDFIGLRLRIPTAAEWASMIQDETVQAVTEAWEESHKNWEPLPEDEPASDGGLG